MNYVVLVTLLLLIQYLFFMMRTGKARVDGKVVAPAISGDENFERNLRVQTNTLEQLIITLPAMWICASYFRPDVAAILGAIFLIGRFLYSASYLQDPTKRVAGMMIGMLTNVVLIGCGLYAVVARFI